MDDFLMRDDAPLTTEEWARLDDVVVAAAKKLLVGRRVIPVHGPVGPGLQTLVVDRYQVSPACVHQGGAEGCCEGGECQGECDCEVVDVSQRMIVQVPLIHKDFVLHWRDIATSRQFGLPLELGQAAAAAAMVARKEDEMIFAELLAAAKTRVAAGDWDQPGSVFANLVAASSALVEAGAYGPYAAVVSPAVYAKMHRPMGGGGRGMGIGMLEIVQARELASGGVFQTPALKDSQALLIAQGPQNVDLMLGQDLATAYLGPEAMAHRFRVLESLALRIKRPEAIAVIATAK
mgnify:CR=1 FL=1